jgi:hypothetical protein
MPDIPVGAQIFDLVFHPSHSTVYTGLLTGQIKAFSYDQSTHKKIFSIRPSKRSCRSLTINDDGSRLYAAGKGKAIQYALPRLASLLLMFPLVQLTQRRRT